MTNLVNTKTCNTCGAAHSQVANKDRVTSAKYPTGVCEGLLYWNCQCGSTMVCKVQDLREPVRVCDETGDLLFDGTTYKATCCVTGRATDCQAVLLRGVRTVVDMDLVVRSQAA